MSTSLPGAPILSVRNPTAIARAVELLQAGQIIIIPTDTVYGIAVLPDKTEAIAHLYEIRNREPEPASPFLMARPEYLDVLARPTRAAQRLARAFWPGLLTLILPSNPHINPALRASPVALRVPNFPMLLPLFDAVGGFLFATGAVCCGEGPAITAPEAAKLFGDEVSLILDGGRAPFGIPSTIVDCIPDPPEIRRRGLIPEEKIWEVVGITPPHEVA
ncbi:MAG: L-threonylcarbamoyladenylate synthase [Anaerolineae bacterium]